MIDFLRVSKHFGTQDVLLDASFRVNHGEHIGVVGSNGSGKSTIFSLISGEISSDSGEIKLPKNTRLGYLHQQLNPHEQRSSLLEYTANAVSGLDEIHEQIAALEHQLNPHDGRQDSILSKIGDLQTRFENMGGYDMTLRAEQALCGLGFHVEDLKRPFSEFSGGWQMRAELARTLIAHPDILLLDEPSNYLDLPAVEWLQQFLRDFPGTMLLISHDRYLLDSLTRATLECAGGIISRYQGNYSYYVKERISRQAHLQAAHKNQERRREKIEGFVERFRAKSTKASQVQSRIKQLEKMEEIRSPVAATTDNVCFRYDDSRWIFNPFDLHIRKGEKIALVGFNGMGKTTLLRLLAGILTPTKGKVRLGHKVVPGYQSQEFAETMPPGQNLFSVIKDANAEASDSDVRGLLGSFGFGGDAIHKSVEVLSGGEKIRLAFARIFINPPNFLILDEPTTHLDIMARAALEKTLRSYSGTVCFVSHDVEFVRNTAEIILAVTDEGITRYHGNYDYYREKIKQGKTSQAIHSSHYSKTEKKKEIRQERVTNKKERRKRLMILRKIIRDQEAGIEKLEKEQAVLLEQLSSGTDVNYAILNKRTVAIQQELLKLENAWERSASELEEMEKKEERTVK